MRKDFELVEYTADIGIRAFGIDLKETFQHAAVGMFSLITDINKVNELLYRDVEVSAPDREILLVEWLNDLIFLFDTEQLLFKRFDIGTLTDTGLKAHCHGEKVDKSRHQLKRGIKSATYHMLKVEKVKNGSYLAEVLLDI